MALNFKALEAVQQERMDLARSKNSDYSHGGIDTISVGGLPGLATRLMDKAGRLMSLTRPGYDPKVRDESIRDTLLDMANYAEYGVLLVDGKWNADKATIAQLVAAHVDDERTRGTIYALLKGL